MMDWRGRKIAAGSNRSKLMGAGVIVLGLAALGAYAFAWQGVSKPGHYSRDITTNQISTTPDDYQVQQMPPPVSPTAEDRGLPRPKRHTDRSASEDAQQEALQTPVPNPEKTSSENAPASRTSEPVPLDQPPQQSPVAGYMVQPQDR